MTIAGGRSEPRLDGVSIGCHGQFECGDTIVASFSVNLAWYSGRVRRERRDCCRTSFYVRGMDRLPSGGDRDVCMENAR